MDSVGFTSHDHNRCISGGLQTVEDFCKTNRLQLTRYAGVSWRFFSSSIALWEPMRFWISCETKALVRNRQSPIARSIFW